MNYYLEDHPIILVILPHICTQSVHNWVAVKYNRKYVLVNGLQLLSAIIQTHVFVKSFREEKKLLYENIALLYGQFNTNLYLITIPTYITFTAFFLFQQRMLTMK